VTVVGTAGVTVVDAGITVTVTVIVTITVIVKSIPLSPSFFNWSNP